MSPFASLIPGFGATIVAIFHICRLNSRGVLPATDANPAEECGCRPGVQDWDY